MCEGKPRAIIRNQLLARLTDDLSLTLFLTSARHFYSSSKQNASKPSMSLSSVPQCFELQVGAPDTNTHTHTQKPNRCNTLAGETFYMCGFGFILPGDREMIRSPSFHFCFLAVAGKPQPSRDRSEQKQEEKPAPQ